MREINECKAEVFRRSENRIKERRKKRNRILALSAPVCLCVVLGVVVQFPPRKTTDGPTLKDEGYSMVEIAKNNASEIQVVKETDIEGVNHILESLEASFRAEEERENECILGDMSSEEEFFVSTSVPDLTITFSNSTDEMVYLIYGNSLSNTTTQETVLLSEEQQAELMKKIDTVIDGEGASK